MDSYFKLAKQFGSKASVVAGRVADAAATLAEEGSALLAGSRVLLDYRVSPGPPVATAGPADMWKIFDATSKKQGFARDVSVWILNKKGMVDAYKSQAPPKAWDRAFEAQRRSCTSMTRLKHPGVVTVVEALEDNANQMVLVTERVVGSLHNLMSGFSSAPGAPAHRKTSRPSELELKQGMLALAEGLRFLHTGAGIAHCGLCPQVIMVTEDGGWKLSGFSFAVSAAGGAVNELHDFSDPFPPPWEEATKPQLPYLAPELVGGFGSASGPAVAVATPAADMFSLGCVAFEVLATFDPASIAAQAANSSVADPGGTKHQLLPVRSSVQEYRARLSSLGSCDLSAVPPQAHATLRALLSVSPPSRPNAAGFASSPLFGEDKLLRALQFLDSLLQREHAQKVAFLQDLAKWWPQFDDRLLRIRVVPAILREMQQAGGGVGDAPQQLHSAALPVVLAMLHRLGQSDFQTHFLPLLSPVLDSLQCQALALAVAYSEQLAALMCPPPSGGSGGSGSAPAASSSAAAAAACARTFVPMLGRALEPGAGPRLQEATLRALSPLSARLDYGAQRASLLPKVYSLVLSTTSAGVRAHALLLLSACITWLDKQEAEKLVEAVGQVTAIDRSAPTLVSSSRVVDAVSRKWGAEISAARLLPLLCPLLTAPSLSPKHFGELMGVVQGMLTRIQQKAAADGAQAANAVAAASASAKGAAPSATETWDVPLPPAHAHKPQQGGQQGEAAWKAREAAASAAAAAVWQSGPSSVSLAALGVGVMAGAGSGPVGGGASSSWMSAPLAAAPAPAPACGAPWMAALASGGAAPAAAAWVAAPAQGGVAGGGGGAQRMAPPPVAASNFGGFVGAGGGGGGGMSNELGASQGGVGNGAYGSGYPGGGGGGAVGGGGAPGSSGFGASSGAGTGAYGGGGTPGTGYGVSAAGGFGAGAAGGVGIGSGIGAGGGGGGPPLSGARPLGSIGNSDPFAVLSTAVLSQPAAHVYTQAQPQPPSQAPLSQAAAGAGGGWGGQGGGGGGGGGAWDSFQLAPPPKAPATKPPVALNSLI